MCLSLRGLRLEMLREDLYLPGFHEVAQVHGDCRRGWDRDRVWDKHLTFHCVVRTAVEDPQEGQGSCVVEECDALHSSRIVRQHHGRAR